MRESSYAVAAALTLLLIGALTLAHGCKKKAVPVVVQPPPPEPPPQPPPPPAPTINLTADPLTITAGQSSTLKWSSTNATSVSISGGFGNVEASGTKEVKPTSSTTYTATATGPGGRVTAETRITVTEPPVTPPPKPSTETELLKTADEILKNVARIRGLELKGPVQKGIKSKEEVAQYLRERIRDEYDASELRREGKVLKKLGLIPQEMDYEEFIVKLLTEQVGGYYDPDKKTFFISGWLPLEQQAPVMAHELTHALQDQYFDLNRFIKHVRKMENDDMVLARQALVEGEGMAVMFDYILQPLGKDFAELQNIVEVMRTQITAADSQFEVFKNAPMFLKETLLFPYGYGAAFVQKIRSKEPWPAVNRIYSDLPESTEQIIHPEKYFDVRDKPRSVEIEDPSTRLGKEWRISYRNVLGEFTTYLLLKLFLSEEESLKASSGWGGDRLLLVEKDGGSSFAVFQESVWDSATDADEFYEALSRWLQLRFPQGKAPGSISGGLAVKDNGEYHSVQRNGARVRLIVGLPQEDSSKFKNY